ncbi:MAG: hypothetical protein ACREPM_03110 [Gemmatimonadaceae bacterium]
MRRTIRLALFALAAGVAACGDGASPPKPTAVVFVAGPPSSFQAGTPLSSVTVEVKDERGNPISGQPLTIAVNGGTVTGAPTSTNGGATSIGAWTLASKVGANVITVTSGALPALSASVQGTAGPPAKLSAPSLASLRAGPLLRSPTEPWERVNLPASPGDLTPTGGLLIRSRKTP